MSNPVVPKTDLQSQRRTAKSLAKYYIAVGAAFEKWQRETGTGIPDHRFAQVGHNMMRSAYLAGYEEGFQAAREAALDD